MISKTIDFKKLTFVIPYHQENTDRANNLNLQLNYLNSQTQLRQAQLIVVEADQNKQTYVQANYFLHMQDDSFPKNSCINIGINNCKTEYVCLLDIDCLISEKQYVIAMHKIENEGYHMVHPFSSPLINIPKTEIYNVNKYFNFLPYFNKYNTKDQREAPGGCVIVRKSVMERIGGENELFRGYGPEDIYRNKLIEKLGYKCSRVIGPVYHLTHDKTINQTVNSPLCKVNTAYYHNLLKMTNEEVIEQIDSKTLLGHFGNGLN